MRSALKLLPQAFGGPILGEIARHSTSRPLSSIIEKLGIRESAEGTSLADVFVLLFDLMRREYRCEYYYKNEIAQQLMLTRHPLAEACMLTEFKAGESKADVVIINGTSTVYEIKTDLDSFDRLGSQLEDYRRVFDRVYLVVPASRVVPATRVLGDDAGIIAMSDSGELQEIRAAPANADAVDVPTIFRSLRRDEYTEIIHQHFGYVPQVPNGYIEQECMDLFRQLTPEQAHAGMVRTLRRRNRPGLAEFISAAPVLAAAGMGVSWSRKRFIDCIAALRRPYRHMKQPSRFAW